MVRCMLYVVICFGILACDTKNSDNEARTKTAFELTTEAWPKRTAVKPKAQAILNDWPEYQDLEKSFDALYTVANREDLSLVIENLVEKQKALEESEYPETFGKPQVKSRQKVFKTFMLKVKGDLYYRTAPEASVTEMITAYNAFREQFNVIVSNTVDLNLILEEVK